MPVIYPFTAIVGQERMRRALVLNAVDPRIGGVLIRGERGTAKSTAARALAALLPQVSVVTDCRFGCDPERPPPGAPSAANAPRAARYCRITPVHPVHQPARSPPPKTGWWARWISKRPSRKASATLSPGVLAAANRGLLYIDEVNLLDDHVVDVLLDSAAMGMNIVEREGISFTHPARFILVGTMNPEEGDLRPQLLDRFALSVEIHGIREPASAS